MRGVADLDLMHSATGDLFVVSAFAGAACNLERYLTGI